MTHDATLSLYQNKKEESLREGRLKRRGALEGMESYGGIYKVRERETLSSVFCLYLYLNLSLFLFPQNKVNRFFRWRSFLCVSQPSRVSPIGHVASLPQVVLVLLRGSVRPRSLSVLLADFLSYDQ